MKAPVLVSLRKNVINNQMGSPIPSIREIREKREKPFQMTAKKTANIREIVKRTGKKYYKRN